MIIQFTVLQLMTFLIFALAIVAGIMLLPILWNVKKVVGSLRSLVETNQDLMKKNIKTISATLENAEQISSNVLYTTDKLKISVPLILENAESVTQNAKGTMGLAAVVVENMGAGINDTIEDYKRDTSGFMSYFHIVEDVLKIIIRTFSNKK